MVRVRPHSEAPRVVRGGSWNNNARNLRCANRNRNEPENRNRNLGFRVVFRPPNTPPGTASGRAGRPRAHGLRPPPPVASATVGAGTP